MSNLLNYLLQFDEQILLLINSHHSPFFDLIMWNISNRFIWIPLYLLLIFFLIYKFGFKKTFVILVLLSLLIYSTDQICASIIRPLVGRIRPSSDLNPISNYLHLINDHRGGNFGFPSCHAANGTAMVFFLSKILRNRFISFSLVIWVSLISYSRIYMGLHYPSDIIAGFIIGFLIASGYLIIYSNILKFYSSLQIGGFLSK